MKVCIIGSGYVGLVSGVCFADFGVDVTCVDKDSAVIETLNSGEVPIYEPGLKELLLKNSAEGRLKFTTDIAAAIKEAQIVFIAVGTPEKSDGSVDLSFVEAVTTTIAENLNGYKVIATKSTVPVGTGRSIEKMIRDKARADAEFDVVSNPEFLREGSAVEDFMRPNRVILGAETQKAIEILKELYSPLYLIETPFVVTDIETAELIKYASNAFLATKISFINEMAELCERSGANVHTVAKAMGLDKRIGSKFLHPGPGFGGSCFPKDTAALVKIAEGFDYDLKIVKAAMDVNSSRIIRSIEKIKEVTGGELKGKTIAVLGLTFKPNTDDVRESPAIKIVNALLNEGAVVKAFDPVGMENAKRDIIGEVTYSSDVYSAIDKSDVLVLCTE
ncbi:MAG: UDP-glucose/GDP-mannose dehydrogenase family protein, partial [Deltaproteobacteria bacterium]|nr:UDP-glucose/GDP-mannose dehydrogenase family protein [Deltaproteobacteria bacterium]